MTVRILRFYSLATLRIGNQFTKKLNVIIKKLYYDLSSVSKSLLISRHNFFQELMNAYSNDDNL